MKRFAMFLAVVMVGVMITTSVFAQQDQTPIRKSWGQLKVLYGPDTPKTAQPAPADQLSMQSVNPNAPAQIIKPGAEMNRVTSWRVRPYGVNEFWVDPNNPGSGKHVVMFFRISTNMCRYPAGRLWQSYERDWLNGWQLWVRYPSANTAEYMLFASGGWWWGHRLWNSAWGLSQQFELCF